MMKMQPHHIWLAIAVPLSLVFLLPLLLMSVAIGPAYSLYGDRLFKLKIVTSEPEQYQLSVHESAILLAEQKQGGEGTTQEFLTIQGVQALETLPNPTILLVKGGCYSSIHIFGMDFFSNGPYRGQVVRILKGEKVIAGFTARELQDLPKTEDEIYLIELEKR